MDPIAIIVQWAERQFKKWTRYDIASWCSRNFPSEKAIFHKLRIERRLGIHSLQYRSKMSLSPAKDVPPPPFCFRLIHGFKRHRSPK